VDVVRVASHCTEADTTRRHIELVRNAGRKALGVLMMSHMAPTAVLVQEALKMESYGAEGVVIMDSAGSYMVSDVTERIRALTEALAVDVGFHGHNNLGLAVANSLAAVQAGATIVDGTIRGFGAGAGNTQLEVLVAVLDKAGYATGIDLYKIWEASDAAAEFLVEDAPAIGSIHIVSGLAGVFSGFEKPVRLAAAQYGVDYEGSLFSSRQAQGRSRPGGHHHRAGDQPSGPLQSESGALPRRRFRADRDGSRCRRRTMNSLP